jgi:hypothetical protein
VPFLIPLNILAGENLFFRSEKKFFLLGKNYFLAAKKKLFCSGKKTFLPGKQNLTARETKLFCSGKSLLLLGKRFVSARKKFYNSPKKFSESTIRTKERRNESATARLHEKTTARREGYHDGTVKEFEV